MCNINDRNQKILLFYKSDSNPLNIIYSNKLDCIITQNHIEKRGNRSQLNIKSPRFKDYSNEWISFRHLKTKVDCLKDINLFIWSIISKDVPKWAQDECLINSYFNSIDLTPFYPSLELIKTSFSTDLQETLFEIVILSKKFPEFSRAASNAISILRKLGFSLSNKDLQSVSIPYSDLSNAFIVNTNFQNSNLNFVNFSQSRLHNVNFRNCSLENAKFSYHQLFITYKQIGAYFDFSKCGKYLAAFGSENDKVIRIWNIASDILIKEINVGSLIFLDLLQFSPSGQYITTIKEGIVTLFDQQNDYKIITFEGFHQYACCFAFSSCETYIAAGSLDKSIKIWFLKNKELIHSLSGHEAADLKFSPCNNFLYIVGHKLKDSYILVLALRPKDVIVPCYKGKTFICNKLKKGRKLVMCLKEEDIIKSITFTNNGKFVISFSTNISIWNINLGEKILCYSTNLLLSTAAFNLLNLIAVRADDGTILVFNIETQQFIYETYCEAGKASKQLAFLSNKKSIASASESKGISFFDISNLNYNKPIMRSNYIVNSISFSPCGKYFVIHRGEAKIELWDLTLHRLIKCIEGISPNPAAKIIMYSFYGTYIVTLNGNSIYIYSPGLEFLNELKHSSRELKTLAISYDEKIIVSGDVYNTITIWKFQDHEISQSQIPSLSWFRNEIKYLGFSQSIETFVSCSGHDILIWSVQEKKCIETIKRLESSNALLQASPCHQLIAYASGVSNNIFLYNLQSYAWEKKALICRAYAPYKSIKFSPSGKYIAALSIKGIDTKPINEIYIWHMESKQLLSSFKESAGAVTCFEFSYSENIIAVGIKNCIVKFWDWEKMIAIQLENYD